MTCSAFYVNTLFEKCCCIRHPQSINNVPELMCAVKYTVTNPTLSYGNSTLEFPKRRWMHNFGDVRHVFCNFFTRMIWCTVPYWEQ